MSQSQLVGKTPLTIMTNVATPIEDEPFAMVKRAESKKKQEKRGARYLQNDQPTARALELARESITLSDTDQALRSEGATQKIRHTFIDVSSRSGARWQGL